MSAVQVGLTAAAASAAGSIASQAFGIATGMQGEFDWRSVGLAALSGGVSGGLGGFAPLGADASPLANLVARAAVGSALTQGVSVAIGLQRSFSWANVAASAIGAGVDYGVGNNLPGDINPLVGRTITSFAAGTAASLARGGRVSIQQVATDAFGNALGSSLTEGVNGGNDSASAYDYVNDMDRASHNYNPAGAYGYRNGTDVQSDQAYDAQRSQEWIGQSDAIQARRLHEQSVEVAQDRFRVTERQYRQATDTGAVIRAGDTLERLTSGDKEMMGRYISGMGLSNPNRLQVGQSMRADWSLGSTQAVGLSNEFYAADAQVKTVAAEMARMSTTSSEQAGRYDDGAVQARMTFERRLTAAYGAGTLQYGPYQPSTDAGQIIDVASFRGAELAKFATRGLSLITREMAEHGYRLVAPEVYFQPDAPGARSIRIDGAFQGADGKVVFGEAKMGNAEMTKNQKVGIPTIEKGQGTFYGSQANELASKLGIAPDQNGRFRIPAENIRGVYMGTYERSTAVPQRMQILNDAFKASGGFGRRGDL